MGIKRSNLRQRSLAGALFTPVQQKVLGLLFGQAQRRFATGEIIRHARSGTGATHRQLRRLAEVGLVLVTPVGNQRHYQANPHSPVFEELRGLVVKTVGVVEPLRAALAPLAKEIRSAFVFGSVAKGTDKATSDVDLLVVSDTLGYAEIYEAVQEVERVLARSVNPTVRTSSEWRRELTAADSFARRIEKQPRLLVLGDEDGAT